MEAFSLCLIVLLIRTEAAVAISSPELSQGEFTEESNSFKQNQYDTNILNAKHPLETVNDTAIATDNLNNRRTDLSITEQLEALANETSDEELPTPEKWFLPNIWPFSSPSQPAIPPRLYRPSPLDYYRRDRVFPYRSQPVTYLNRDLDYHDYDTEHRKKPRRYKYYNEPTYRDDEQLLYENDEFPNYISTTSFRDKPRLRETSGHAQFPSRPPALMYPTNPRQLPNSGSYPNFSIGNIIELLNPLNYFSRSPPAHPSVSYTPRIIVRPPPPQLPPALPPNFRTKDGMSYYQRDYFPQKRPDSDYMYDQKFDTQGRHRPKPTFRMRDRPNYVGKGYDDDDVTTLVYDDGSDSYFDPGQVVVDYELSDDSTHEAEPPNAFSKDFSLRDDLYIGKDGNIYIKDKYNPPEGNSIDNDKSYSTVTPNYHDVKNFESKKNRVYRPFGGKPEISGSQIYEDLLKNHKLNIIDFNEESEENKYPLRPRWQRPHDISRSPRQPSRYGHSVNRPPSYGRLRQKNAYNDKRFYYYDDRNGINGKTGFFPGNGFFDADLHTMLTMSPSQRQKVIATP